MRGCCLPLCLPLSVPLLGGALRARGVFLRALVLSPSQASPWGLRVAACGHCLLECGHESWQPGGGGLGQLSPRPLGEFGPPFLASTYRKVCARLLDLRDRVDLVDAKNTHHLVSVVSLPLEGKMNQDTSKLVLAIFPGAGQAPWCLCCSGLSVFFFSSGRLSRDKAWLASDKVFCPARPPGVFLRALV